MYSAVSPCWHVHIDLAVLKHGGCEISTKIKYISVNVHPVLSVCVPAGAFVCVCLYALCESHSAVCDIDETRARCNRVSFITSLCRVGIIRSTRQ